MRTTIRLDDALLQEAKQVAAHSGRTLTQVIETALREALARREAPRRLPIELVSFGGGRIMPGVDLEESAALLGLLDERDAPS